MGIARKAIMTIYTQDEDLRSLVQARPVPTKVGRVGVGAATQSGELSVDEVLGSAPAESSQENGQGGGWGSASADDELGNSAGESEESVQEASLQQLLARQSPENNAETDLENLDGYESSESRAERLTAHESAGEAEGTWIPDAGSGAGISAENQEFLPVLAKLATSLALPAGQALVGAIRSKLSRRTQRQLQGLLTLPRRTGAALLQGGLGGQLSGIAAQLLQQAPSLLVGGESGFEGQVDEAAVEEAVQVLEVIIGSDDRVRIQATQDIHWRRICALRITFKNGKVYRGTGFFIGPRTVATAGHCVHMQSQGGWAAKIEVIPGANGAARPFGAVLSGEFRSVTGWVQGQQPASDYGCIVLPKGSFKGGSQIGSFGFSSWPAPALTALPAVLAGYPGDKPFAELWGMSRKIKSVGAKTLTYDIDTVGGQSGAPVYIKKNGQRYVVGIHNYGALSGNSATRITPGVFARLKAWSQL